MQKKFRVRRLGNSADKEQSNTSDLRKKGEVIIMMRSLFSGVSGLKVHQTRMDVIGNNIANINTIGFKGSRTTFSDMLSQLQRGSSAPTANLGGINPRQIGLGAAVESVDLIFTDASPQQTGKNTDLALSGNGLFVLKRGSETFYTRNGAFEFDESGNFVLPGSGLRVQGWNATPEGVLNTNALATDIVVPVGKAMEAEATTQISYSGNFNKEELLITKISYSLTPEASGDNPGPEYDVDKVVTKGVGDDANATKSVNVDGKTIAAATITLSNGKTMTFTSGYYEVGHSVPITTIATIYDSLGGKHEVTLLIDKAPTDVHDGLIDGSVAYNTGKDQEDGTRRYDNRWRVYLAPGVGEIGPGGDSYENTVKITESDQTTVTAKMSIGESKKAGYLYFDESGKFISNGTNDQASVSFSYGNGNGAGDNIATIDFTGLSQYANNTTSFPTTNGYTSGVLQSIAIDGAGIISGTYTNGQIRTEAQIAVAQFSNNSGLTKVGTTIYQESNNSGTANVKTMTDFGVSVISSALEMSNVDIANEFAEMIITQRGFQANSKMTTVSDEMLETVVNMKR